MNRKRVIGLLCLLSLAAAAPAPEQVRLAVSPVQVELDDPPLVALTFDDGPRSSTTGPLLDGLALREVPATFFLVGSRIPGNEELVRRMAEEGHQIGTHTYDHVKLEGLSAGEFDLQMSRTRELLTGILGEGDFWLRPPYGLIDEGAARRCGSPLILWSVDPEDWRDSDVDRIVSAVAAHASDGDIILLHDLFPSSAQAALKIVDVLLDRGYCFVTVEQLMEERGVTPEAGTFYRRIDRPEKTD